MADAVSDITDVIAKPVEVASTGTEMTDDYKSRVLQKIAIEINDATKSAEWHARSAMQKALEAGKLLIVAKEYLAHGEFIVWVQNNCTVTPRMANSYMRLATAIPLMDDADRKRVSDLPIREAIKAIATSPTAPPRAASTMSYVSREQSDRTRTILGKSATALRNAARGLGHGIFKTKEIDRLRTKLQDTLAELDRLTEAGKGMA